MDDLLTLSSSLPDVLRIQGIYTVKETGPNGVHFIFVNGITVSIQWGPATYSDNHDALWWTPLERIEDKLDRKYPSKTAEVYAWLVDNHPVLAQQHSCCDDAHIHITWMLTNKTWLDEPAGYQTMAEVLAILQKAADWQNTAENRHQVYEAYAAMRREDEERHKQWYGEIVGDESETKLIEGEDDE